MKHVVMSECGQSCQCSINFSSKHLALETVALAVCLFLCCHPVLSKISVFAQPIMLSFSFLFLLRFLSIL